MQARSRTLPQLHSDAAAQEGLFKANDLPEGRVQQTCPHADSGGVHGPERSPQVARPLHHIPRQIHAKLALVGRDDRQGFSSERPFIRPSGVVELQEDLAHNVEAVVGGPVAAPTKGKRNLGVEHEVANASSNACCIPFPALRHYFAPRFKANLLFHLNKTLEDAVVALVPFALFACETQSETTSGGP